MAKKLLVITILSALIAVGMAGLTHQAFAAETNLQAKQPASLPAFAPADPPVPRHEVIPNKPFPNSVWVAGHWFQRLNQWDWVAGYWMEIPKGQTADKFVPGQFSRAWGKTQWIPAHWRTIAGPQGTY